MPHTEKDHNRFDRALNAVDANGGAVRLVSWPDRASNKVPECTAAWGDIATTLRTHVSKTNSAVLLNVTPNGGATEEFRATWKRAERSELYEGEPPLHEDAMDTLVFQDDTTFHFDVWSDGKPFVLVDLNPEHSAGWFKRLFQWCVDNISKIFGAVAVALILSWLGLK